MRIALLGDLHGNMVAVEAVARDIALRHVDAIYCLGDMTGKGPSSPEAFDWALDNCDLVLMGNWEHSIVTPELALDSGPWFRAQLGEARLKKMAALPLEHHFTLAGRRIRLIHGRPVTPNIVFSFSDIQWRRELFECEAQARPQVVGFADVHRPFYQQINDAGTLFNTGSVGNPLADQPHASYVILEGEKGESFGPLLHTLVQLPYDREAAARVAQDMPGLPAKEAFVNELRTGRYSRVRA